MNEFQKIDAFLQHFQDAGGVLQNERVVLGPGDDCAVLAGGETLVMTTDAIVEDVHFRSDWFSWEEVGHKALAVNLSDLAAMGAVPVAFSCAIAAPPTLPQEALNGIAAGMGRLAALSGGALSGGNFTRSGDLSITLTALGSPHFEILRRDSAQVGDRVLLIGELGVASAELAWLLDGKTLPPGPSALKSPRPLIEEGKAASQLVRCAIDISDGLAQDLGHIAAASGVRIEIDPSALPRSERFELLTRDLDEHKRLELLLAGGEDYALLVCGPAEKLKQLAKAVGGVEIGRVSAGSGLAVLGHADGAFAGHDHFS